MNNNILKNERGILTIDFLFAFVMVFGFTAILYSFAFTLSVAEVVQYVSYASARNYNLAHKDESEQRQRAQQKYQELVSKPSIASLMTAGWFKVGDAQIGDFNDDYPDDGGLDSANFVGVRIPFSAPVLYKRIPFLGTTGNDPEGFTANINSYLAREPTFQECQAFTNQRGDALNNLGYTVNGPSQFLDNGC